MKSIQTRYPRKAPIPPYLHSKQQLGKVFRELARQRESEIEEGHFMADHVHALSRFLQNIQPSMRWDT